MRNIIEYYYMWKTTDRYVQQKRVKAVEAESKLKQVYIPNYNSSNSNKQGGIVNGGPLQLTQDALVGSPATGRPCESCGSKSFFCFFFCFFSRGIFKNILIFSLPPSLEQNRFLPNGTHGVKLKSSVVCVKPVGRTGRSLRG